MSRATSAIIVLVRSRTGFVGEREGMIDLRFWGVSASE